MHSLNANLQDTSVNWDDLRFVLAIARAGSLSGAARQLGVNQTTAGRRLTALEEQLNAPLFLRSRTGFTLTEAGEAAISQIELVETAALELANNIGNVLQRPAGLVRIASMPWIFDYLLAPALPVLASRYPGIELHAIADLRERSLSNREAEMSLRFEMQRHGQEREFEIAAIPYAVYGPKSMDADDLPWIGSAVDSGEYEPEKWLDSVKRDNSATVPFRSNDAGIIYRAVCHGVGKALLPDVLAQDDPTLVRLSGPEPEIVRHLRLLVHPDVERFSRITAVIGWLREALASRCGDVAPALPRAR
jgi:DNA-binding transcriptional LysR family regulator